MKDYKPFLAIGAVLLIGAAIIAYAINQGGDGPFTKTAPAATPAGPKPTPFIAVPPQEHGKLDSKVVVEEFADYQCPACGILYSELKKIEDDYKGRVKFQYSNFPITARHPYAMLAARAAEAAAKQGEAEAKPGKAGYQDNDKFWAMHDKLFAAQNEWGFIDKADKPTKTEAEAREYFAGYAKEIGLNVEQFKKDLDAPETDKRIVSDQKRAQLMGVSGTPTIFMSGPQFPAPQMLKPEIMAQPNGAGIRQAIEYLLGNPPSAAAVATPAGKVAATPAKNGK